MKPYFTQLRFRIKKKAILRTIKALRFIPPPNHKKHKKKKNKEKSNSKKTLKYKKVRAKKYIYCKCKHETLS